jgi:TM2 domain-containing membrane protein YozV
MNKIIYALTVLLFVSCSTSSDVVSHNIIQKRKYTKGYFIKKQHKLKNNNPYSESKSFLEINALVNENLLSNNDTPNIYANSETDFSALIINNLEEFTKPYSKFKERKINAISKRFTKKIQKNYSRINQYVASCDVLIMMDGSEITAKILEITPYEIKYKNCDNLDGPTFTKSLSTVFKIKYANGTSQVMNNPQQNNSNNSNDALGLGLEEGEKSQSIAIALWFFLGIIGVHRFYLGHIGLGVLYLLTGGLCGIGWLIDGILFLTGDLKPADGKDYGEKII